MNKFLKRDLERFFEEDGLFQDAFYFAQLPKDTVILELKFKGKMMVAGLPYFFACFEYLGAEKRDDSQWREWEGKVVEHQSLTFELPFSVALTGERLALNLLQHSSSVATQTHKLSQMAKNIPLLDTRKTTPGLRALEKYAVGIGGGHNHRFGQTDVFMIKDNHKEFFEGLKNALAFFRKMPGVYRPLVVEIHSLKELREAIEESVKFVLLDNFTPEMLKTAIDMKPDGMNYELSGGISEKNLAQYLLNGVDGISMSALTQCVSRVDISLDMKRKNDQSI